ncbi:alpha/beta hydrolase [Desulfurispira natronophila]|uniref:Serine aminopeptidase S33 domain-containing protein n=1 Tax=Desulfurispira natronophila TaxID=682562 RepID=A0A7W8DG78_9BACT|nr:alpha/beta hydrolase [Desulfurispira natronophila]MBB5021120.1 hypothetical protein [Desulfurispira natronophila]
MSILNHTLITQRYFFPFQDHVEDPFWVTCRDGVRLSCLSYRPHQHGTTLIHFHGNGEVIGDYGKPFMELLAGMGVNVLLAEFRGYSLSGGEPELGKMLEDVEDIVAAAGVPSKQILFFGRSVGSIFAVHGAYRFPECRGLILESAIADPLERILLRVQPEELGVSYQEVATQVRKYLNHQHKMASYTGPVLIMHTHNDGLVDVRHAHDLYQWAGGRHKKLEIFPHGNHNDIFHVNAQAYLAEVRDFLTSNG